MASVRISKSKRFNEIFHLLLAHNISGLLRDLATSARNGTAPLVPDPKGRPPLPERVRRLIEDLGPSFIKIGQLLGTRPDLIPAPFVEEFKKLYDQTTPTPFAEVRRVVESELRRPLTDVFESFGEQAIASASIGQVHRAVLKGGQPVAVKVQHPGIQERMATDFDILRILVRFTERLFAATRVWQPVEHLEEVRHMLDKELDYRHEGRIQQEVETNFRHVADVKIPHVYPELSTARVLVMEFIEGVKFRDAVADTSGAVDHKHLAKVLTHAMAQQVFIDRIFHADPSPGNLLILRPKTICFLDFGAVGIVTKRRSRLILELLTGLASGNIDETGRCILELCDVRGEYDHKRYLRDVERVADYYERERSSVADPVLLQMILDTAAAHRMTLPPDFMLITRAIYQFDGMCKDLDPSYELIQALQPFVGELLRDRLLHPEHAMDTLKGAAVDLARMATRLPAHLEKTLYKLEKGDLSTRVELKGLEDYKTHQMRIVFILGFTLLAGFILVGSAIGSGLGGAGFARDYAFLALLVFLLWSLVFVYASGLFQRRKL